MREDNRTHENELQRSENISYYDNASNPLIANDWKRSSRPSKSTSKGAHRRLNNAIRSIQTQRSTGSNGCREKTVAPKRSAKRSNVSSNTELDATQNTDLQLIAADEPGKSQNKFQTA